MMAVVDIGNTRLKWAWVGAGRLEGSASAVHRESLDAALETMLATLPAEVDAMLVANVAGEVVAARLAAACLAKYRFEPEFLSVASEAYGLRCAYDDPARLGVDRWVALIAAHHRVSGALCVIDAGTTVTFDAADAEGRHLGGLIFAGPRIVATALHRGTSGIGATGAAAARPRGLDLLGRNTDTAVAHAAMLGLAAALREAVQIVGAALAATPAVILTGGDAERLGEWLETDLETRADLVLEGLAFIVAQRGSNDA